MILESSMLENGESWRHGTPVYIAWLIYIWNKDLIQIFLFNALSTFLQIKYIYLKELQLLKFQIYCSTEKDFLT